MRSRGKTLTFCLLGLLMTAQAALALSVGWGGQRELLLAVAGEDAAPLAPAALDEAAENRFLTACTVKSRGIAQALQNEQWVDIIGTGAAYRELLGYPLPAGGFFTETACETRSRHAVLNHTAAHWLFGGIDVVGLSFTIAGESWQVVGVMDDGDNKRARVYIPFTLAQGETEGLFALADETVGRAAVLTALQELGVTRETYDLWHLGRVRSAFDWRLGTAWRLAAVAALLLVLRGILRRLRGDAVLVRHALQNRYPAELLWDRLCVGAALWAAAVPACSAAILFCVVGIAERVLLWRDDVKGFWQIDAAAWGGAVKQLWQLHLLGTGLLAGFAVLLLWAFLRLWKCGRGSGP